MLLCEKNQTELSKLVAEFKRSDAFQFKKEISTVSSLLDLQNAPVKVGDDCAAIYDGDGYLLLAIEGMLSSYVQKSPKSAGFSAVLANLNDIAAMGGRPTAIVDALWSTCQESAEEITKGMKIASELYNVAIVGGHCNLSSSTDQLAVAVLGKAKHLLTSFEAKPKQHIIMAVNLKGKFFPNGPFFDATRTTGSSLQDDLDLLPQIAERGLANVAKDISNGGVLGTLLMLLECSKVGAEIDLASIPKPPDVDLNTWLQTFTSYGFLLTTDQDKSDEILSLFYNRDLTAAVIGEVTNTGEAWLRDKESQALLYDFNEEGPFIGG